MNQNNIQEIVQPTLLEQMQQLSYTPIKILGEGAFGKVYQCISKQDKKTYAIKVIAKNVVKKSKMDHLRSEANILSKTDHANIVKLYSMVETQSKIFLKMELIKGGTLAKLMKQRLQKKNNFKEEEIAHIMKSIFQGVSYIHSFNIIHRDLKPCMFFLNQFQKTFQFLIPLITTLSKSQILGLVLNQIIIIRSLCRINVALQYIWHLKLYLEPLIQNQQIFGLAQLLCLCFLTKESIQYINPK